MGTVLKLDCFITYNMISSCEKLSIFEIVTLNLKIMPGVTENFVGSSVTDTNVQFRVTQEFTPKVTLSSTGLKPTLKMMKLIIS